MANGLLRIGDIAGFDPPLDGGAQARVHHKLEQLHGFEFCGPHGGTEVLESAAVRGVAQPGDFKGLLAQGTGPAKAKTSICCSTERIATLPMGSHTINTQQYAERTHTLRATHAQNPFDP
jgi:hypothetical protein